tara:strand:+ start:619 stop:984 length:366 start_codon:yes stop_codon:yes gene_type:complete
MNEKISYKPRPSQWKIKLVQRSRNRMKIQVKLSAQETEALRNFLDATKPPEVSNDTFFKGIFMKGWEVYHQEIEQKYVEHIEKNQEEYAASGFTFNEEGKLTGYDSGEEVEGEGEVEVVEE